VVSGFLFFEDVGYSSELLRCGDTGGPRGLMKTATDPEY